MHRRRRSGAQELATSPPEPGGALVRLAVTPGAWAEDIPPVPEGFDVTVSFDAEAVADDHRDALELLGYRVVEPATSPSGAAPACADFLVSEALLEQRPTYWRSLARMALRTYPLAFGPAAAAVATVVETHRGQR